jgi:putative membrane protein
MKMFLPVIAAAMLVTPAMAQSAKPDKMTSEFVTKAAQSDMFEIQASQLAAERGDDKTKGFAQQMVTDHTKTTSDIKGLIDSGKLDAQPPADMSKKQAAELAKLQGANGAAFDKLYASQQVAAHKEAVALFKTYSKSGKNEDLKSWTAATEPALEHHLAMAQQLGK